MGHLIFSLARDPVIQALRSPLNVWFLDDTTLAGPADVVSKDLDQLVPALSAIGLQLNTAKTEVTNLREEGAHGPRHDYDLLDIENSGRADIDSRRTNNIGRGGGSASAGSVGPISEAPALLQNASFTPLRSLSLLVA